jgi:hypothetical protein
MPTRTRLQSDGMGPPGDLGIRRGRSQNMQNHLAIQCMEATLGITRLGMELRKAGKEQFLIHTEQLAQSKCGRHPGFVIGQREWTEAIRQDQTELHGWDGVGIRSDHSNCSGLVAHAHERGRRQEKILWQAANRALE